MIKHPIRVARSGYRGADKRKRAQAEEQNRIASELETHINGLLINQVAPIKQYSYSEIASDTGHPIETVLKLCHSVDFGHNGFTAFRSDLTLEQALNLSQTLNA